MKLLTAFLSLLVFALPLGAQDLWQPRVSGVTSNLWSVVHANG